MATGSVKQQNKYVQGTFITNTVPNSAVTQVRSATLSEGMWMLFAYGQYAGGIGNVRASWYILHGVNTIAQTDNTGTYGGATTLCTLLYLSSPATIYFDAYQLSGSQQSLKSESSFNCIRLY